MAGKKFDAVDLEPEKDRSDEVIAERLDIGSQGHIYLPQMEASAGPLIKWRSVDLGQLDERDWTLGAYLRQRINLLDEQVRNFLSSELNSSRYQMDEKTRAAIGKAYGLELRPGDSKLLAALVAAETAPERALYFRPDLGHRWMIEAGPIGTPRGTGEIEDFQKKSPPLCGIAADRDEIIPNIDEMTFDQLQEAGLLETLLAIVPSCRGVFMTTRLPVVEVQYSDKRGQGGKSEVRSQDITFFVEHQTNMESFLIFARNVVNRHIQATKQPDGTRRIEAEHLNTMQVKFKDKSNDHSIEMFHNIFEGNKSIQLADLLGKLSLARRPFSMGDPDVAAAIRTAMTVVQPPGSKFEVKFEALGTLTCLHNEPGLVA